MESISLGTLNMLEAIRFYNAESSECFGDADGEPATERTPIRPRSPYAVANSAAYWQVANYREAYGLFACTGLLFNNESCLRQERFVTKKIVESARRIASGSKEKLILENTKIIRDWGWSAEYVEAMWMMLQLDMPDDFVIATGENRSLQRFVELANSLNSGLIGACMWKLEPTYSGRRNLSKAMQIRPRQWANSAGNRLTRRRM